MQKWLVFGVFVSIWSSEMMSIKAKKNENQNIIADIFEKVRTLRIGNFRN